MISYKGERKVNMKVKIGNTVYDSTAEPILLMLDDEDVENISNMGEQRNYCSFPHDEDVDKISKWMNEPGELAPKPDK